nr:hypothetical protein [Spirosoma oryzae]
MKERGFDLLSLLCSQPWLDRSRLEQRWHPNECLTLPPGRRSVR